MAQDALSAGLALSETMNGATKLLNNVSALKYGLTNVGSYVAKDEKMLAGRTENNRVVNFDGNLSRIDEFVDVQVTEVLSNSLRGVQVSKT